MTVASASTQGPSGRPVSAERPEGTSTESTRAPPRAGRGDGLDGRREAPLGRPESPVPRTASITTSPGAAPSGVPSAQGWTGTPAVQGPRRHGRGVALELPGRHHREHPDAPGRLEQAGRDPAVPAVVAAAADHHEAAPGSGLLDGRPVHRPAGRAP